MSKITRMLGWVAKTSFEQGVRVMLENIDYWREAPVWTPASIAEATGGLVPAPRGRRVGTV